MKSLIQLTARNSAGTNAAVQLLQLFQLRLTRWLTVMIPDIYIVDGFSHQTDSNKQSSHQQTSLRLATDKRAFHKHFTILQSPLHNFLHLQFTVIPLNTLPVTSLTLYRIGCYNCLRNAI